jgi:hypothetical protein
MPFFGTGKSSIFFGFTIYEEGFHANPIPWQGYDVG